MGHQWSSLSSIKHSDTWCPYYAEYKNNKSPLLWICKNQYKWYAKFDNIVNKNTRAFDGATT
ncbi:hypothetical protein RhiirC2_767705 [Rhizophagus irregularis]|uniref:Uncharacterized protein n=1 Tax=Rhizophagus irregularis TaxID=588596 RepID=A0A2N1P3I2_9GLOM|nr:hypothetical protein RhiirC2_767705 [Rhizophagus irregularis]